MQLKPGTLLQGGKYRIEKVLGQGGFGITYLAEQSGLDRKVAIKEFFMKEHCNRDGETSFVSVPSEGSKDLVETFRQKFIKEAKTIAGMDNHHIIRIIEIFEEKGTAYYVMEYLSGGSLSERIPANGLPESEAVGYIRQVAEALSYIHSEKILHLDVKPSNILFRKEDEAVLIDFGISKHYDEEGGSQTSSTPVGVSRGYAPLEQYKKGGVAQFSPATDVYSLGATLYKLLTGLTPPDADEVNEDGIPPLPASVSRPVHVAVEAAMSPKRKDRPLSVEAFMTLLNCAVVSTPVQNPSLSEVNHESLEEATIVSNAHYHNNVLVVKGVEYPMVYVEGGEFEIGRSLFLFNNRRHSVRIDSFRIGKYEVTQDLWEAVMGTNPSYFKGPRRPVETVSWLDCQEFICKLNELTGMRFRLPTEAEWEFAARGGRLSRGYKYSGANRLNNAGWHRENSGEVTHDVGLKVPNELGLYDMTGNVSEWCSDWYEYFTDSFVMNPKGPDNGAYRVNRGGSFFTFPWAVLSICVALILLIY